MALVAEELVEEWLNRKGYFTIRGIKVGYHEIDLLAVRVNQGNVECRHVEVQVSHAPVSYVTDRNASKKTPSQLTHSVRQWIAKKYDLPSKVDVKAKLASGNWTKELVYNEVKSSEEIEEIRRNGITVHKFRDVVKEMRSPNNVIGKAVGADLLDLFLFATPDETERR